MIGPHRTRFSIALVAAALALPATMAAQQPYAPATVSEADYERAERMLAQFKRPLVTHNSVSPDWAENGRDFAYRSILAAGWEWIWVDVTPGVREVAFDHAAVAAALNEIVEVEVEANRLPLSNLEVDGNEVRFELFGDVFTCERTGASCSNDGDAERSLGRTYIPSPNGERAVFRRDHNLWMVEVATGEETQLTFDGIENYGYATNDAGWARSPVPVVRWAPDSRHVATFRHDGRGVSQMYLVTTNVGAPELQQFNYPLPEDSLPFMIERLVIDTDAPGELVWMDMEPDAHRSTICDHIFCGGTFSDVDWSESSRQLAFVSSSRDHKSATLRVHQPRDRRGPDRLQRDRRDLLRGWRRPGELERPLRLERVHLVVAALQLGAPLPVRSRDG